MKNVHLITTDKPSRLRIGNNGNFVYGIAQTSTKSINDDFTNQHIYITDDSEIREGDWFITTDTNKLHKSDWVKFVFNNGKKIILTTDQDLISDGIEQISEDVLLKIVDHINSGKNIDSLKIIIPQEEFSTKLHKGEMFSDLALEQQYDNMIKALGMKQETLEEAIERTKEEYPVWLDEEAFILGAKWQQERSYSEEDIINALHSVELKDNKDYTKIYEGMKKWFEQNKNK